MHGSCYVSAGALFTAVSYLKIYVRKEKTLKANFLSGAKTAPELREIGAGLFAYVQHGSWGYSNAGLITQNRWQSTKQPAEIVGHRRPKDSDN